MAYSNKHVPLDPSVFPPVQTWMTWVEERKYVHDPADGGYTMQKVNGEGKLRHYSTLFDARKGLSWIGSASKYKPEHLSGTFVVDWAVFNWDGEKWVEAYSGLAGEKRNDNALFKRRFSKKEKMHPTDFALETQAVESILRAALKVVV